jgi:hypothetical protein
VSKAHGAVKTVGSSVTRMVSISDGQLIQIRTASEQQMIARPIIMSVFRAVDDIGFSKFDLAVREKRNCSQVTKKPHK